MGPTCCGVTLNSQEESQRGQMRQFYAIWAIFGDPWALFSWDLFTVGRFLGTTLIYWGRFSLRGYKQLGAVCRQLGSFSLQPSCHTKYDSNFLLLFFSGWRFSWICSCQPTVWGRHEVGPPHRGRRLPIILDRNSRYSTLMYLFLHNCTARQQYIETLHRILIYKAFNSILMQLFANVLCQQIHQSQIRC